MPEPQPQVCLTPYPNITFLLKDMRAMYNRNIDLRSYLFSGVPETR